jgi:hypothetical protein
MFLVLWLFQLVFDMYLSFWNLSTSCLNLFHCFGVHCSHSEEWIWCLQYTPKCLHSSGMQHHAVWYVATNVLEKHTSVASILRVWYDCIRVYARGTQFLQTVGIYLPSYMVSHPRTSQSLYSTQQEPQPHSTLCTLGCHVTTQFYSLVWEWRL